ncbi:hypothetical protein KY290_026454 [Solanum tuberosum]|uniref:DNA-3-methyladenine glycosylase I n=1 Tax=Solanum tuberosum TaxID=4113 RepID=A0ABQ7UWI5_SOLTU|nr:hypothetical protein KY284_034789 [Solanum tuberosum]KAH0756184.1 hypothetical protein KY290_026454 [Solanum tuberosum]
MSNKNVARTVISPTCNPNPNPSSEEELMRRCNWITSTSDKVYVQFHDECWGVPVYDDQHKDCVNLAERPWRHV